MRLRRSLTAGILAVSLSSGLAVPVLLVQDGAGFNNLVPAPSGVASFADSDGFWSIVITTGVSSPPNGGGTVGAPKLDLSITANSLSGSQNNPLRIYFAGDNFGPTLGQATATLTGSLFNGTGAPVSYNSYFNAANLVPSILDPVPAGSMPLTASGSLPGPDYADGRLSTIVDLASPYSLVQFVTVDGGISGGSYTLDAGLAMTVSVPEPSGLILFAFAAAGLASALGRHR